MSDRLQKVLAHAGVASRRASEKLILTGHVRVNGKIITTLGAKVEPTDRIEVDHHPIKLEDPVYFVLNKPRGVITSATDEKDRKTVLDYFKHKVSERIYPVGRLDYDTSGVLLLTNDGQLDFQLTHPKHHVPKTYLAKVEGIPDENALEQLRTGVRLPDHQRSAPAEVRQLANVGQHEARGLLELTIFEGHNHEVKNMLQAVGHPVERLKRTAFAGIDLGGLEPGQWRPLRKREVRNLLEISEAKE
ncbi:pseudouridylate synthase [Fructilactobacillus florum 8D]|uniref:Pseudouridine synthase n=1 Tax=Fructilactobacillus florum 8D TaxID=1221538 RepID=W9EIM6_9LACO|nr:pseudouridine synthase [Fructilactobacillus florum]EKK20175.1 pseudouridylate synthase [Fructilactobacillus florum 2F]ETO40860.1 pseudouridylate synthase [Fructilactobacillus florum 8D]